MCKRDACIFVALHCLPLYCFHLYCLPLYCLPLYCFLARSTTISRTLLKSSRIVTLSPSNALLRKYSVAAENPFKHDDMVEDSPEFLYIPSLLTLDASIISNQIEDVTDDDHCVSLLCDLGYTVHSLDFLRPVDSKYTASSTSTNSPEELRKNNMNSFSFTYIVQAIDEAVQWHRSRSYLTQLSNQSRHTSLHLIVKEVAVLHALYYLSEVG